MNALSRLFWALPEFNNSWRAHAAMMRAATVLSLSQELAPLLAVSINLAKGFDPGFDGTAAIEDLFEELEYLKDEDYRALRQNCLLGVCASFESFSKTCAAALSYDPNWRERRGTPECLAQDTSHDFSERYGSADKRWKNKYTEFLRSEFDWLEAQVIQNVADVLWLRNQVAHNGCHARDRRYLQVLGESFLAGKKVVIDKVRLGKCVNQIRLCVNQIADGTPYLDAI